MGKKASSGSAAVLLPAPPGNWTGRGPSRAACQDEDAGSTLCFQERVRLETGSPRTIVVLQKCLLLLCLNRDHLLRVSNR